MRTGSHIIPHNRARARKIHRIVQTEIATELPAARLYLVNGTYNGDTQIEQHVQTRGNQELCLVDAGQQSRASGTLWHGKPEGERRWRLQCSCLPPQTRVMKLQSEMECMPIKSEIVYEGVDDEAIEVHQLHVVAVGRVPAKQDIEHRVASGHAQHRTWCDACMRARGIAGGHQEREPGRKTRTRLLRWITVTGNFLARTKMTAMNTVKVREETSHSCCHRCKNWNLCCNLSTRVWCE